MLARGPLANFSYRATHFGARPPAAAGLPPASQSTASRGVAPALAGQARSTTILAVRRDGSTALVGDGQVSRGSICLKPNARKVRRLSEPNDGVVCGFAGATADCMSLLQLLEQKLEEHPGQLLRACVELAQKWRTDKFLRHLEASLIVSDGEVTLELTGNGDVLESHDAVTSIGSGGPFAAAAARGMILALAKVGGGAGEAAPVIMSAEDIATECVKIAAAVDNGSNQQLVAEVVVAPTKEEPAGEDGDKEDGDPHSTSNDEVEKNTT